jgi:hypothetical protein
MQHVAGISTAGRPRSLMNDPVDRTAAQELIVHLIDQDPHGQLVNRRNLDRAAEAISMQPKPPAADAAANAAEAFKNSRRLRWFMSTSVMLKRKRGGQAASVELNGRHEPSL